MSVCICVVVWKNVCVVAEDYVGACIKDWMIGCRGLDKRSG